MGSIRRSKTKRRTRDLDQIHADIRSAKNLSQHKSIEPAEDLPGLGRLYCIECARYFEGENGLIQHRKGKNHKRRLHALRAEPYTQKEAEAAVGLRTDNGIRYNVSAVTSEAHPAAMGFCRQLKAFKNKNPERTIRRDHSKDLMLQRMARRHYI